MTHHHAARERWRASEATGRCPVPVSCGVMDATAGCRHTETGRPVRAEAYIPSTRASAILPSVVPTRGRAW